MADDVELFIFAPAQLASQKSESFEEVYFRRRTCNHRDYGGPVNLISDNWNNDNLQSLNQEKNEYQYQSFTRIGRQFQSLKHHGCAAWTSVSFPLCQRSCLILSASFFGRSYHSRYQNFEFTVAAFNLASNMAAEFTERDQ